jgi:hypothetical protein
VRAVPVDHDQQQHGEYRYRCADFPERKLRSLGFLHKSIFYELCTTSPRSASDPPMASRFRRVGFGYERATMFLPMLLAVDEEHRPFEPVLACLNTR